MKSKIVITAAAALILTAFPTGAAAESTFDVTDFSDSSITAANDESEASEEQPASEDSVSYASASASVSAESVGYTSVEFYVTPVDGAVGYEISNAENPDTVLETVSAEEIDSAVEISGLEPGKSYTFEVRAVFEDGTKSEECETVTASTSSIEAVSGVKCTDIKYTGKTTVSAKIVWKKSKNVSGYKIYRIDNGVPVLLKKTDSSVSSCTLSKLKTGTDTDIYVKAYLSADGTEYEGAPSEVYTVGSPTVVPNITLSNSANKITVKFSECKGADGYVIYMSENKNSGYKRIKINRGSDRTSYTKSGLSGDKTYYFKVRTFRKVNGKNVFSDYSEVKSAVSYKYVKAVKSATMYESPSFSGKYLSSVTSGKSVIYIGKSGNWYKVRVGGKTGYIYNKAFGVKSNVGGAVNSDNLSVAADDILFDCGATPLGIQRYVTSHVSYQSRNKLSSRNQMVIYAMNYRCGSCYYYAAFCDYLLERAGYEHIIVDGCKANSPSSKHNWNLYKSSSGWRHLDACYRNWNVGAFCGWTDSQVLSKTPFYWNRNNYPAAR